MKTSSPAGLVVIAAEDSVTNARLARRVLAPTRFLQLRTKSLRERRVRDELPHFVYRCVDA
jgi:hypothetical protein